MPPKIKPRPRQSARKNPETTREHESVEALSAPSPKEALANDDNEVQIANGTLERTGASEIQPESSVSRGISTSTPSVATGSPFPRRSVQRLKSALPRNSSNPASSLHATESAETRPSGLKFKPKSFIRRSIEEREAEEKAEAERRAARHAAEGTSSINERGGYHGRGRVRGQRGGFGDMNRSKTERFNLSHEPSGHLGGSTIQNAATSKSRRGGGLRSGRSGTSEPASRNDTSRVKKESTLKPQRDQDGDLIMSSSASRPKRTKVKKEEKGIAYISSEDELDSDGGERVNIEDISTINLISSEDEEEDEDEEPIQRSHTSKGKRREMTPRGPSGNLMPVRIQRQEHVERSVGVNTDASSLTSAELRRKAKIRAEAEGSLFLPELEEADDSSLTKPKFKRKPKDVEFVRNERKWKGVYQDEDDESMVKIKDEPKDDEDTVMTENPAPDKEVERINFGDIDLANASTQGAANNSIGTLLKGPEEVPDADNSQPGDRLRRIKGYHSLRPVNYSEEEEEDDILAGIAEITLLKSDASEDYPSPELASSTRKPIDDGDLAEDHKDTYFQKDGREEVYLFQLPPLVPSLRDASKTISKAEDKKKNKAETAEVPNSSASNNPFAAQVKDEPGIKDDPDGLPHETAVHQAYTSDSFHSTGGRSGVLNIHANGSMFATWGGMSFEILKEGTGAQLAQELMVTDFESAVTKMEDESRWEEKVNVGEKGWAMGQTHPGHVCVPELLLS